MTKRFFLLTPLILYSVAIFAEDSNADTTIKNISSSLAVINQELAETSVDQSTSYESPSGHTSKKVNTANTYEKVINTMRSLMKEYKDNKYVKITGFELNIGFSPSVSITFEFK
jgi:hypothetical protein